MQFITHPRDIGPARLLAWAKAAAGTSQADPFCSSPAWQIAFHEAFSPDRRLFLETGPGGVLAFAEKRFSPENAFLTPIEAHWLFGCPLMGKDAVDMLSGAMDSITTTYAPHFPKIVISGVRPGGILPRRLLRGFASTFNIYLHSECTQCAASLSGGVDGFLSRRSANHRSKLKKAARRALAKGIWFERVAPASLEEADAAYARMLHVESRSWKGTNECGMAEPPAREFYATLLRRLSLSKSARVIFAKSDNADIGFIFGGMAGKVYRGQQFSYDNLWRNYSVGNLMQVEKVRWLCEQEAARYDMGPLTGPLMEYKAHWAEKQFAIQTWIFVRR